MSDMNLSIDPGALAAALMPAQEKNVV